MGLFDRWKKNKEEVRPGAWIQARQAALEEAEYNKGDVRADAKKLATDVADDVKQLGRDLKLKAAAEVRGASAFLKEVKNSAIARVTGIGRKVKDGAGDVIDGVKKADLIRRTKALNLKVLGYFKSIKVSQTVVEEQLKAADAIKNSIPEGAAEEDKKAVQELYDEVLRCKTEIDTIVKKYADEEKGTNLDALIAAYDSISDADLQEYSVDELEERLRDAYGNKEEKGFLDEFALDAANAKNHEKESVALVNRYKAGVKKANAIAVINDRKLNLKNGFAGFVSRMKSGFKKGVKGIGMGLAAGWGALKGGAVAAYKATENYIRTDPLNLGSKIQNASANIARFGTYIASKGQYIAQNAKIYKRLGSESARFAVLSKQYEKLVNEYAQYYGTESFPEECKINFDDFRFTINLNNDNFGVQDALDAIGELAEKNDKLFDATRDLSIYIADAKKQSSGRGSR